MASKENPVAIIGMAVRLPGAESCDEFWKLLIDSKDTVSQFPENRTSDVCHTLSAFQSSLLNDKNPFFTGSFFKSVDKFDADLFSINPKEALFIEPEQRFFLELVWELLEDAGYAGKIKGTKTGVYVGNTVNKYKYILTKNHPHGNNSPCISSWVSYTLGLSGPAMTVASGCSSSLLVVHLACQGLLSSDCEMAIAGGITLDLLPLNLKKDIWYQLGKTGPNVKCRSFDVDAKQIAKGEGCGVILLKPLNKAMLEGDYIYAVLEASTANQDGHSNGMITAPHPITQANLLCQAWNLAKISPDLIGYFETHGTGMELGDSIEVSGITTAFKSFKVKSHDHDKIPMSSVKANIGHLADGGAGIVALIKVVLCLINGKIPPSANYSKPNPHINWDAAPVYVNTELLNWEPDVNKSRYASINAFGLGTHVHTVVREFTDVSLPKNHLSTTITNEIQILAMAANSQQSLYQFVCKITHYFRTSTDKNIGHLRNICYTVNTSREQNRFSYKAIVYATNFDKMTYLLGKLIDTHFDTKDLTKEDVNDNHDTSGFAVFHKYSTVNLESGYPTQEYRDTVKSFLSGKGINWSQFYHGHCDVKRVPMIPTYAFDRKRFWPEINKPINVESLQLEHQIGFSNYAKHEKTSSAEQRLTDIINDVLGVDHNWQERGDDDLFALGMDSLTFTRVCMKLQSECLVHGNLLISELHKNPTFNGLKNLLDDKYFNTKSNGYANTIQTEVHQPINYNKLSTAQHRMLIMQETAPESTAYVETIAYYTANKLDVFTTFKNLLEHHPVLASRIDQESLTVSVNLESINCNVELELIKNFEDANGYLAKSIPAMKVLSSPLAMFRVLKAEDKFIFVIHVHHIIADDITLSNIARDFFNIIMNGTCAAKESCSFSHKAVIENESNYLESSQVDLDKDFWDQAFLTLPPEVNLAILPKGECIWNDTAVYKAKHISKLIPGNIIKEISRLCNNLEVTEFHFYLACTALVLQRYLGVHELSLAVPVTTRADLHQMVDRLFENTVLFRLFIDVDSSIRSHIQAIARSWLQVLIHSRYPFDKVINTIQKKHGISVSSFCCVMFNHVIQNRPSINELLLVSEHAKMPLSVNVIHNIDNGTIKLMCEWASEIIDDGIAERIIDGIFEIFEKVLSNSNSKIVDVHILSSSEYNLLKVFSQPCKNYEVLNINETFKMHVINHPDSTAIICKEKSTTYAQLETMALTIASELHKYVDESTLKKNPVILISEKSEHTIASILGIWKAGGHFLPVSFNTINSLKHILECITPAAILLSNSADSDDSMLGGRCEVPFINVFTLLNNPIDLHVKFCTPVTNEDDLAYIIRTSGSTGKPKQCKVSHKSLGVLANAWKIKYEMNTFEVNVLQWAPLSFDVFIGDLIRGLICSPGTLTICPDELRLDVPYLIKLIKHQKVTIAEVTPQFAVQLVQNSNRGDLDSLHLLILGSDVLQSHAYKKVKEQLNPNQRLLNSYGMTEATIDSAFFEGSVIPNTRSKTIPIGKPLPGVTLHILDPKSLQPCPVGTIGELYISGPVLASGDTEVMYIQNINCDCLKTNDAAAWLPSGDIELLGRLDTITKLRGLRINTTEIENKIVEDVLGVKDACVVVLGSDDVNKFLCAFVVQEPNMVVDLTYLRNQLSGKLPCYMLPDIVHAIEVIPLSQNGKVNFKALPSLSDVLGKTKDGQEMITATINTESQVHTTLKELFSEALGIEISQIHLDKSFKEQGGHSLVLVYFATLVKEKTTYNIGIADIFSYPSINSLAAYIQSSKADANINYLPEKQINCKFECGDIAITGIGLRLPGDIMSLPQLWKALKEGNDIIRDFPKKRINDFLKCLPSSLSTMYAHIDTYQGAFLEAVDQFDCQFFKIPPNEAKVMSPEQRLFLQVATEALSQGKNLSEVKGAKIGVFVGQCDIPYDEFNHLDESLRMAGMLPSMIATRVAYQWDLKGPTALVDTACSSSLMALKQACESMRNGECEGALIGGVNLVLYPAKKGVFGRTSILSPDFHCKPFDKHASGTAVGEGVLCIYAQPLHSALKERKHIYGIIKNIASNNIGHGNGITAPSSISQQNVIKEAISGAHVRPSDISFIECHAMGTVLGDKIELSAINSIFNHDLLIGSAKSMFGHLDSAAGLLGLFKIMASLTTGQIPPTLHFKIPHPEIQNSSIYVPSTTVNWNTNNTGNRLAGLSSFGITGTNIHAIISEQKLNITEVDASRDLTQYPLLLSGKNLKQVKKQLSLHQTYIQELILNLGSGHNLLKLCITVAKRLNQLKSIGTGYDKCRMIITAQNASQMITLIKVIMDAENMESLIQLVIRRNDIYFCSPEYKCTNTAYDSFLINGKIDLQLLFPDVVDHDANLTSCITLALFDESRHWLEDSFSQNTIDSDTEDLLSLLSRKVNETRELIRTLPLGPTHTLKKTKGKFCSAIIVKLFLSTHLLVYLANGKTIALEKAFKFTGFLQKYEKFFFIMIRELFENNLVQAVGQNKSIKNLDLFYFKCKDFINVDPESIANYAIDQFPLWADCFRSSLYCSKSLLDVLMGKLSPLSGNVNFMHQFDKLGDLLGDIYYNMYTQVIAIHAKKLSRNNTKIRILEVGAGVGYVTRQLLPKLKEVRNIEYWFTDPSKVFVDHAKTAFINYNAMMKFSTFDITRNPITQGILGSFDIVVSYNGIHTTEGVLASMINSKSCLGEDGVLFIIESAMNETWATLTWGILDGWWHYKDYELRSAEPMLEPKQWEMILSKVGFASVYSFPTNINERAHVEKSLFMCSAKKLPEATDINQLEQWKCDSQQFQLQSTDKHSEISNEDQVNIINKNNKVEISISESTIYKEMENIWSELLGVKDIQPDDDFNFLSRESLLVIQMIHLVRGRIGYQLEIADTFAYPTLHALAHFIHEKLSEAST